MFNKSKLSAAAALALGGAATLSSVPVFAQEAQRIEITGSAIKRTSVEGPAPVEIITRKDIARTGATSVNELLRSIPSIDIYDQGELTSNSPSGSGTANVRLRGLSVTDVLVLLNGRRLPVNALYDSSGAGAAFDVNSLPIGAIERIEILKDGGSAIYGADAVAGVVNFITKTDYQGIEAVASYGQSSRNDGKEKRAGLAAGFGDLAKDRFNILVGLDILKRDPILRNARPASNSLDFRSEPGGGDFRSSFAPTGNVIDPNSGAFVRVLYSPCPAANLNVAQNRCKYDFNKSILTMYNGADRLSALSVASFQINPQTKAFAELTYSTSKDHFDSHPVPAFFTVPITDPNQLPYEVSPGSGTVYIAGRFMQGGPRMTDRKSDFMNLATGLEGSFGNNDWKASLSRGESKVRNADRNYYDANKWNAATSDGSLNPTVSTNDPAFVQSLKVSPLRTGKSVLTTLNAQLSGDVLLMPAGPLRYAVGINVNRETLSDHPDQLTQAGQVVGSIKQAAVDASRISKAVFGELQIPLLKSVEGQAAIRYDKYPNASATSPKLGVKWTVMPEFALRASYTKSFRAPVLKQLYGAQEEGATTIEDPDECKALGVPLDATGGCSLNAFQVNGSNPNLKPEKGETVNLGMVFELSKSFNGSIDLWRIHKTNDITSPTIDSAIKAGLWTRNGARYSIFTNLQNISERETAGVDLDLRARIPGTAIGNISVRNLFTYYKTNKTRDSAGDAWAEFNGTYALPLYRNGFNVSTEAGPWTVGATINTVGGFWDTPLPFPIKPKTRSVGAHEELDLQVQYSGFKALDLTFGVRNLLDTMPPLSLTNAASNTYSQEGFAELYTARGRFMYLSAKYVFR